MPIELRDATIEDMAAVQAIYAREVETGTASFELAAPDRAEMCRRFERLRAAGLPYLVAVDGGGVAGYAYAAAYRPRPAYRWTVENSVYVADRARRRGLGLALLQALIERCTRLGYRQMIAVIGDSAHRASIELHRRAGFEPAGVQRSVGFKFDRWLDTVQLQRALGDGDRSPPDTLSGAGSSAG